MEHKVVTNTFFTKSVHDWLFKPSKDKSRSEGNLLNTEHLAQSLNLTENQADSLNQLKEIFQNCSDLVIREFLFAQLEQIKLTLVYIDGLTDKAMVSNQIIQTLSLDLPMAVDHTKITRTNALHYIKTRGLCTQQVKETDKLTDVVNAILSGDAVLLVDGHATAFINNTRHWASRSIEDSKTETVIRGPRESFVETLLTNTSLLRRRIISPDLKIEIYQLGEKSQTDVALAYIKGIVNDSLVEEARSRLTRIKIDGVLESGYIEELISDNPYSPFATLAHTDRPDRVAGNLLEGRVAVLVDGTPVALIAPHVFIENIQATEDYYELSFLSSSVRMLRVVSLFIALLLPSVYVAIVSFHHEILPTPLLMSIAAQREAVPLPVFVETLIMEVAFEIIREGGIRIPSPAGQTISLVAGLIIGQAVVRAGLVAGATIIVVAVTALASFTVFFGGSMAIRLLRFPIMFLAASFGLYGLICGVLFILLHMASIRSFGIPYLAPLAPAITGDLKDTVVRVPWYSMRRRPRQISQSNQRRETAGLRPHPPRPKKK